MVRRARIVRVVRCYVAVVIAALFMLPAGVEAAQPTVDGIVKAGEYDHSTVLGDGLYTLSWTVARDMAWFGIQATTTGCVALGIDPEIAMKGAGMVFGWVSAGKATVLDQYSTGMFGPHADDTSLGGTKRRAGDARCRSRHSKREDDAARPVRRRAAGVCGQL